MKIAFTIATANYLAQAKTLADSFIHHNPGYTFVICLLDKISNRFDPVYFEPAKILEIDALRIDCFPDMVERYTLFELSNALKPFVAEYLLLHNDEIDTVLYFDSDVVVYYSFAEVHELLQTHTLVLSPHALTPIPLDGLFADEKTFLNCGVYNGGFFALRRSEETLSFLSWWKERLKKDSLVKFSSGLFVDQIWLNLVPCYFTGVHIVRSPGYNVAYWNLHERSLNHAVDQYWVNGKFPLVFYHFSGYDFKNPGVMSKHQNRYDFIHRPDIAPLFQEYQNLLSGNDFHRFSQLACYFDKAAMNPVKQTKPEDVANAGIKKKMARLLKLVLRKAFHIEVSSVRN